MIWTISFLMRALWQCQFLKTILQNDKDQSLKELLVCLQEVRGFKLIKNYSTHWELFTFKKKNQPTVITHYIIKKLSRVSVFFFSFNCMSFVMTVQVNQLMHSLKKELLQLCIIVILILTLAISLSLIKLRIFHKILKQHTSSWERSRMVIVTYIENKIIFTKCSKTNSKFTYFNYIAKV